MNKEELNKILENHKKWINSEEGGERADLIGANLSYANLSYADLSKADLCYANLIGADLSKADLCYANLRGAALSYANMKGANIDYSAFPLWRGSLFAHFDDRQLAQIAYHLVKAGLQSNNASTDTKSELVKLVNFANKSHLIMECGLIEKEIKEK